MSSHEEPGQQVADVPVSFWQENGDAIETLGLYAAGILVYAVIVNFFYQRISVRVMFARREVGGRIRVGGPMNGFVYLFAFPLFSFAFFLLLSLALLFLGGTEQDPRLTLTLAMAVVLAVRLASYVSEATSHDVAKMLPLGLLGVMLVRAEVLSLVDSLARLAQVFEHVRLVLLYFAIVVVAEYFLRFVYLTFHYFRHGDGPPRKPAGIDTGKRRME